MVDAVLTGPLSTGQDPALRLDRLLLALDQKPCVYDVSSAKGKNGWNQQTLWTYSVELQLRPRCNIFQFSQNGESKDSGDWDQTFPALSASSSPSLGSSPPTLRYPPIQRAATSAKRDDAKAEIAAHVLQRIRVYQLKYPLLFQVSLPSTVLPSSGTTSSSSASSSSSTTTTRLQHASSPRSSQIQPRSIGNGWNSNVSPMNPPLPSLKPKLPGLPHTTSAGSRTPHFHHS